MWLTFWEVDDETKKTSTKDTSKLLITRLVVLISGYLLAVDASGMPLDKLSICGSLGVGSWLGLQMWLIIRVGYYLTF